MLIIVLFLIAIYLIYKWSISTYDYFEKQGIPYNKPLPLIGSNRNLFFNRKTFIEVLHNWFYEFKDEKASGLFEFRRPILLLKDPKLIKQLAVKDFDYFMNHRTIITEDVDPLFGKNLFALKGNKWRDMRATLSPAFTGSKMRNMMDFVSTVGHQTAEAIKKDIKSGGVNTFEFKEFASKFTIDIIASTAFGIEINSFKNPTNKFFKVAKEITNFASFKTGLKFAGYLAFPKLMKILKINLLDKKSCDFFEEAIYDTMKTREKHGIVRNDMIQLMLQAKNGILSHNNNVEEKVIDGFATAKESQLGKSEVKRKWDDADLAAQCFVFFLAGFETVAQTMSFVGYELACNPDVQQKLFEEISEMNDEINGKKINYEQIQKMKYLDAVISETLRKWPGAPVTDRICVKDYELKYDNKCIKFEANKTIMLIPIWSIHRDPKYYQNPDKFDPERFNDENKKLIDPDTYLPFGVGPRNCIGSRFALMEIKTIFYYLLLNFSIEVTEKTQIPLEFEKTPFAIKPKKGIWVELRPRN
ncbi:hypothetical protein PVAND_001985 [Polypedilum vanderplanki]|uniref:Cytochrome P450 n=1 Tax=Polypedilum vanderplanki TaxID=319348 RepID=A0A9J6BPX3_POLVA|nr:hypothetical protein PVAND_001985 [Polypedilum vanderplanki]